MPATSLKVTLPDFSVRSFAFDLPKPMAPPRPPPCIRFMKKIQTPISNRNGSHSPSAEISPDCSWGAASISTSCSRRSGITSLPRGWTVWKETPSVAVM